MDTTPVEQSHPKDSKTWGMSLWDETNPYSLVNRLPEDVKKKLFSAREAKPELFKLDDKSLMKTLKSQGLNLTVLDNRLRVSLWMEYDKSITQNRMINPHLILSGFCTDELFYERMLHPHKVAWIFSPPTKYEKLIEEALLYGLEQLRMVLEEDNYKENGKLDIGLMKLKMQIVVMLDQRQKGGYVQRLEEKKVQLNLNQGISGGDLARTTSMAELDQRIKEMELQIQKSGAALPAPVVDVEVVEQVTEKKVSPTPGPIPAYQRYPGANPKAEEAIRKKKG